MRLPLFLLLSFPFLFISQTVFSQQKPVDQPIQFRAWSGYSFSSVYLLGKTKNAQTLITGFGFRKAIREYGNNTLLFYTADVIPYLYYDYPKRDENNRRVSRTGFGFSPIGFLFVKSINKNFSYQLGISGSFIFMEREFPTDKGRKLNYTFDPSATLQNHLTKNFSLAAGYKFHHISNAQTGIENPGLDSNFLFLTITIK